MENKFIDFIEKNYIFGSLRECIINFVYNHLEREDLPRDNGECAFQMIKGMIKYLELKNIKKSKILADE